jgi:hypothetical protein
MSTVKVNTVDKRTGSTLTLGGCGTTVTLGAGATQSGFGRTGTVDWCTTAKTAPFTGVSGNGYFVNTTCGAVTVTLPGSPSAGDIISIADYASTFQTNNLTLCNNSSKINGVCATAGLSTQGQSVTLVYVDATRGWKNTMDSTSNVTANAYITATGGTVTTCGNYKIHTFTSDGCFSVSSTPTPANAVVDYLVVAGGGGGGGGSGGGGGGAGGFRESYCATTSGCYTASPLASATSLPVSVTTYPITVGGGGSACTTAGGTTNSGTNSIFDTITAAAGGGGGSGNVPCVNITNGAPGGSGGGGGFRPVNASVAGGTGNTPPVAPPQGNNGGTANPSPTNPDRGGGGGGASAAGTSSCGPSAGPGGNGVATSITGSSVSYAGGGGGGKDSDSPNGGSSGDGGTGGGGNGASNDPPTARCATAGTTNTGGGGGGRGECKNNATGGSGIVIIRYKFQ